MKNIFSIVEKFLKGEDRLRMPTLADIASGIKGGSTAWGSRDNPQVDPNTQTIPAGLFVPTYPITHTDAGTNAMTGITGPTPLDWHGRITIIPGGAFTWTTATNIALAGTAVVGKALDFIYSTKTNKWYPSYIA